MGTAVQETKLLAILEDLARRSDFAVVHFSDGEILELKVWSTMHAEEGGDFEADLIRAITPNRPQVPDGSFINCYLGEVVQVWIGGVCTFAREGYA